MKIYEGKRGEVLQPERVGNAYVVGVVTEINEEGTQSIGKARNTVEPVLRNRKKAELIKKQLGTISTLEAAASVLGKTVESADSVRMSSSQALAFGYEPKVIGAAFNPNNRGKVVNEAIAGSGGVFVVRVDNVSAMAAADGNIEDQRKSRYEQAKMQYQRMAMQGMDPVLSVLKEAATIKDNRAEHF